MSESGALPGRLGLARWRRHVAFLGAVVGLLASACGGSPAEVTPPASSTPVPAAPVERAPVTIGVTFTNAQTGASEACPDALKAPRDQRIAGAGTWTLTPGDSGTSRVAATYESGARATGVLTVTTRMIAMEDDDGAVSGWARRVRQSTLTLNDASDRATGTSQVVLTSANGTPCILAYDLSLTFVAPLLPPRAP